MNFQGLSKRVNHNFFFLKCYHPHKVEYFEMCFECCFIKKIRIGFSIDFLKLDRTARAHLHILELDFELISQTARTHTCNSPGPHLRVLWQCHLTISSTPSIVKFLLFVEIESCTLEFKYIFNLVPLL
jgi:hypothetical protein